MYLILLSPVCLAQNAPRPDAKEQELRKKIESLSQEINDLQESEDAPEAWKKYRDLELQIQAMNRKYHDEIQDESQKMNELANDEDVQKWQSKIQEKYQTITNLRYELQGEIQNRGRELHERRSKELATLAIENTPMARKLGFDVLNYPKVDGSTSAWPLDVIIACKMLDTPYQWSPSARYSGTWGPGSDLVTNNRMLHSTAGMAAGRMVSYDRYTQMSLISYRPIAIPENPDQESETRKCVMLNNLIVQHTGTHGGYENVITGQSDFALVARKPSDDELKLAEEKDVELDVLPVALDAFVFIKHFKNPVDNLTTQQIRDIYAGKIKNWKEIGGPDNILTPYRRNRNSGSQELMETLVMKDTPFEKLDYEGSRNLIHQGMGGPYIGLTNNENGLAYSVYYYEHFMAGSPNTELLAVDGVMPAYNTIQSREYPYTTEVYAVVRKSSNKDSAELRLRDWLLTDEGQAVVRESGYVPTGAPNTQKK